MPLEKRHEKVYNLQDDMNHPGIMLKRSYMLKKFVLAPILFLAVVSLFTFTACSKSGVTRGGETRATIPPENFSGDTARAYQVAKEIPEVLDSLYCYCDCEKHFGHKSLLSCYVDEHAVHCDICQDEALMAYELHKQGKDIKSIRDAVDQRFSQLHHHG